MAFPVSPTLAVAAVVLLIGLAVLLSLKKAERKPDYYVFFVMGLLWIPLGIAVGNWGLAALGFVFLAVGLANRKKWKENRRDWSRMSGRERKLAFFVMAVLGLLILFLLASLYLWG